MALRMGIPLVFYGENEAEYGNAVKENTSAKRDLSYFASERRRQRAAVFRRRTARGNAALWHRAWPDRRLHAGRQRRRSPSSDIEVHYLGYYLKWTPQENYYYAAEHIGFQANDDRTEGTYSKYNSIDDKTDPYHYWTTLVKFGIGRATYDASQEIRNGHMTREEGVALVHRYDQEFPRKYFADFLDYLDMDEDEFFAIADSFRSPHLWKQTNEGWVLRHRVENI